METIVIFRKENNIMMEDDIRNERENELLDLYAKLETLEIGSKEYQTVFNNAVTLERIIQDEVKNDLESDAQYNQREIEYRKIDVDEYFREREEEYKRKQDKINFIFRCGEFGLAGLTLAANCAFLIIGFGFEEKGSFTSQTMKNLYNKMPWMKKK